MKFKQVTLSIFCIGLIFQSCMTTPVVVEESMPTLDEATFRTLTDALTLGKLGFVLQDLSTLEREYPDRWNNEFAALREQGESLYLHRFEQSQKENDFKLQIELFRELEVLGLTDGYDEDFESILKLKYANWLRAQGDVVSALILFEELFEWDQITPEILLEWSQYALSQGKRNFINAVVLRLNRLETPVPSELLDFVNHQPTPLELMSGTATIWVNRGIKVAQGMGYADHVIGSGFFIDNRGHLITNYHVISSEVDPEYKGYSRLFIKLPGSANDKIPAEVIGWDPVFDIALLKTVYDPGYIFSFKNEETFLPGDKIFAIGSPGGLDNTITSGIISATERRLLEMGDTIQVDVPINSGNSGGPLLNSGGDLVGVVFAGIEQFEGINFAIPSSWVSHRIPGFFAGGKQELPWLGVDLYENKLDVEITYAFPGSPAAKGGLQQGDILTNINGFEVKNVRRAHEILLNLRGQRLITLQWLRDNETYSGLFYLDERPDNPMEEILESDVMSHWVTPFFGISIESAGKDDYVVKDVYPGSVADETGFSVDDPITIYGWEYDEEVEVLLLQLRIQKRKAGFMESVVQISSYSRSNTLL